MGRWGDREMGRWGDGEIGRWGDGEMEEILMRKMTRNLPLFWRCLEDI
ncbi:MAG: hypothetical protein F6J94_14255 [Moorea sp. SIO1F2]|nr:MULTISPECIES: hypothetical protein [unclassified Moorena]NEO20397.1 hypothetical protein [Moorena sp. SIO4A5]NEP20487.1 hypothetical protein [Moorena sp. SIO3I6]NEQ58948.1 hypothetical protein [Moorena sp. SIO4A1]NET83045.1 hypothetical protein [Moorena sp. SIO1F2]